MTDTRFFIPYPLNYPDSGQLFPTPKLTRGRLAIFGWYQPAAMGWPGSPIQDLNYTGHSAGYVDYSHGVRLIRPEVFIDGVATTVTEILKHPTPHTLLSDEGAFDLAKVRYAL